MTRADLLKILIRHGLVVHTPTGYQTTDAERYEAKREISQLLDISHDNASTRIARIMSTIDKGLDPLAENRGGHRQRAGRKRTRAVLMKKGE